MTFKLDLFINYSLVFLVIALSGSLLQVGYVVPTFIVSFLFVLVSILLKRTYYVNELRIFAMSFFCISFLFFVNFIFSSSKEFGNYVTVISFFLFILLVRLSFAIRNVDFIYYLYRSLKLIILVSLIGFVVIQFIPGKQINIGKDGFTANTVAYIFYHGSSVSLGPISINRNQAFFWEPGVLSVYCNLFLFLSLFVYKDKNNSILALICIITTFSTTGIFLLVFQILYFLKTSNLTVLKKIGIVFCLLPIGFLFINSFMEKKVQSEEEAISSYGMRSFDLYSGMIVTINNPFFGVGLNKEAFIIERNKYLPPEVELIMETIDDRGNSNSLMQLFFSLGLFLGGLVIYLIYIQDEIDTQKKLFLIIVLISLITEPLLFSPIFLFFICSGIKNKIK